MCITYWSDLDLVWRMEPRAFVAVVAVGAAAAVAKWKNKTRVKKIALKEHFYVKKKKV